MTVQPRVSIATENYDLNFPSVLNYPIHFKFLGDEDNVRVFLRLQDGTQKDLRDGNDYTVIVKDGVGGVWGEVKLFNNADIPENVDYMCVYRVVPNDQSKRFDSQTVFSKTVEDALDKLTMLIQDNMDKTRYIRAPKDAEITEGALELPPLTDWSGEKVIGVSDDKKIRLYDYSNPISNRSLRQGEDESVDESFIISLHNRKGKILGFDTYGRVNFVNPPAEYKAGENVEISEDNVISATDTKYTGSDNVFILPTNKILAKEYRHGDNVIVEDFQSYYVINATDTKYTAGENVQISETNVISATDTKYTAVSGIYITPNNEIGAYNQEKFVIAGENVHVEESASEYIVSATDTKYTAGENINISEDNVISSSGKGYTAGENVQISETNVISATDTQYTAGYGIYITPSNEIGAYNQEKKILAGENVQIEEEADAYFVSSYQTPVKLISKSPGLNVAPIYSGKVISSIDVEKIVFVENGHIAMILPYGLATYYTYQYQQSGWLNYNGPIESGTFSDIAVSPDCKFYATESPGVIRSSYDGQFWDHASLPDGGNSTLFQILSCETGEIVCGTGEGLWIKPNGGSWMKKDFPNFYPAKLVTSMAIAPGSNFVVLFGPMGSWATAPSINGEFVEGPPMAEAGTQYQSVTGAIGITRDGTGHVFCFAQTMTSSDAMVYPGSGPFIKAASNVFTYDAPQIPKISVVYNDGKYWAFASNGEVKVSSDLMFWTSVSVEGPGKKFVTVLDGEILTIPSVPMETIPQYPVTKLVLSSYELSLV